MQQWRGLAKKANNNNQKKKWVSDVLGKLVKIED